MENIIVLFFLSCIVFPVMARNIVLILVDDLDIELDGMIPLMQTQNLIVNKGASFTNCYAAVPICCPNRASILTGRYQHNHWVLNNSIAGGCNDQQWKDGSEKNTFAIHLNKKMGYRTFYAGKYLNQYGTKAGGGLRKPPGWDYWYGLVGNSKYYNYSLSINGTERKYGNQPQDYLTDVIDDTLKVKHHALAKLITFSEDHELQYSNKRLFNFLRKVEEFFLNHCKSNNVYDLVVCEITQQQFQFPCDEHAKDILAYVLDFHLQNRMRRFAKIKMAHEKKNNLTKKKLANLITS